MKLYACSIVALVAKAAASESDHHSCACEAKELGFTIDCLTNGDGLLSAVASLQENSCDKDCKSEACRKNFLIVQSHHDHCLHDEVPSVVEDALHTYEGICEECTILKKSDPSLENCPVPVCDNRGNEAYRGLLTNGCLTNCATSVCAGHYQVLRAEHDICKHDTLDTAAEIGIHEYEDICEEFNCNVLAEVDIAAQLICAESSAFTIFPVMAVTALAPLILL